MAKNNLTKRSLSSYEMQRIILMVLLVGLIISAIIFGYQTRRENGEVTNEPQVMYEETNSSQEGAE